jgi:hypothetical protein
MDIIRKANANPNVTYKKIAEQVNIMANYKTSLQKLVNTQPGSGKLKTPKREEIES